MQQNSTLQIGTGSGFTVFPNWAFDALVSQGSNALALGTLLLRLIPGQEGEIVLSGSTSRRGLCSMLNWGTENTAKFDQALMAVENIGLIRTRIERGNTKIITIDGRINRIDESGEGSQDISEDSSLTCQPPTKIAPAKSTRPSPAKIAPANHASTRVKEINYKNKINKKNHHRDPEEASLLNDDDEWGNVFSLYAQCFKSIVPNSQKNRFLSSARESGLLPEAIKKRIIALASHPLLASEVTSINAVWHFQHLQKKAAIFDQTVRGVLQDLARRHTHYASFRGAVLDLLAEAQNNKFDPAIFTAYFAADIESLSPASPTGEGENIDHIDAAMAAESPPLKDEQPSIPMGEMNVQISNKIEASWKHENAVFSFENLISSGNLIQVALGKQECPQKSQEDFTLTNKDMSCQSPNAPLPHIRVVQRPDSQGEPAGSKRQEATKPSIKPDTISLRGIKTSSYSPSLSNHSMVHVAKNLMQANTKTDFLVCVRKALQQDDIDAVQHDILTTLAEFAILPNTTLNLLKSTLAQRFKLKMAS